MNRTAHSDQHGTRRRAPLHSYAMAIASALVLAGGLGALAAFLREQDGVLTGVGLGIFTFPPLLALSWLVLVSRHTVTPEPHAEESVERQWLDRALSGGFTDVLTACGLALTAVAVTGVEISGLATLTAVVVLAMVDVVVRYVVISRRES